jgi:ACS family phthalate transporter-like MFS transporter
MLLGFRLAHSLEAPSKRRPGRPVSRLLGEEATYRKVTRRLMPLLVLCYLISNVDRANISIAQLEFTRELGFGHTVYGLGAGIFFIGFLLFEIPSNLLLEHSGARKSLLRIMVLTGLVSGATLFVKLPAHFYLVRLTLGAAQSGFFPGVILYLTYWYPSALRARMTAMFLLGLPTAGLVGNALSGWLLNRFAGVLGLSGWQWMFLLEGFPALILGAGAYYFLEDKPERARWLTPLEKAFLVQKLRGEESGKATKRQWAWQEALRDPRLYIAGCISFASNTLANAVYLWTPQVVRSAGVSNIVSVGLLSAVPFGAGILAMIAVSRSSDLMQERRWHTAAGLFAAAVSLMLLPSFAQDPLIVVLLLAVAAAGHYSALSVFWTIPAAYLPKTAAAGGIAMISTMGGLGAAISPVMLGRIKDLTGSLALGLRCSAVIVALGGAILIWGIPRRLVSQGKSGQ